MTMTHKKLNIFIYKNVKGIISLRQMKGFREIFFYIKPPLMYFLR